MSRCRCRCRCWRWPSAKVACEGYRDLALDQGVKAPLDPLQLPLQLGLEPAYKLPGVQEDSLT